MKLCNFLVLLFLGYTTGNLVSNVHLVDFIPYMIDVITQTVNRVEQISWCNLRVPDVELDIDEVVLGWTAKGKLSYKNGFVNSVQAVDILRDSVQSQVDLNLERKAEAYVSGTLRMHDVTIGYDVEAALEDETRRYTAAYTYPTINFTFNVTRVTDTDDYQVIVVGNIPVTRNLPSFLPRSKATDVFTTMFDPNMSMEGIKAWGPEMFKPIVEELVSTKIEFPRICYNCPAINPIPLR